jgi:hypothetical protein
MATVPGATVFLPEGAAFLGVYLDFLVALGAIFFVKVCFKRTFFYEHFLFKIGEIKISVEILRDNLIKTHDSSAFFFGKVSKINKEAHTKEKVMGKNRISWIFF